MKASSNIGEWLSDPRADEFFGKSFAFKFACLAHVVGGQGSFAELARRHGASRQAAHKHAVRARKVFNLSTCGLTKGEL